MIKIDFEFESKYGVFRDAIHLPEDHGMSEEQLAAMKQQRFDNWIAIIEAPPVEVPVEEQVQEEQPPVQE
jgi:hypothetical protein